MISEHAQDGALRGGDDHAPLVRAAIGGDKAAASELWGICRRVVAAIALVHKPREADLEDIVQDVAVQFVARLGDLRDAESFWPWLRSVSINVATSAGRKARVRRDWITRLLETARRSWDGSGPPGSIQEDPPAQADDAESLGALLSLPPAYAEPFALKHVHGLSYRQIAWVLDLPETTVETRIVRARRMVREVIEESERRRERRLAPELASTGESS